MGRQYYFVYMLHAFDKLTEELSFSQELQGIEPDIVRRLFSDSDSSYPYIFDSQPVNRSDQRAALYPHMSRDFDTENLDYFIEANTV